MSAAEEGSCADSTAAATVAHASDDGDSPEAEGLGKEPAIADADDGPDADSFSVADAKHRTGDGEEAGEGSGDESQNNYGGGLLRVWDPPGDDATPAGPIDYKNVDESPYEHNFEPGDHIIRWDMLPILWPIQIHGIVLEVSEDKSEVTICDFGITSVKNNEEGKKIEQIEQDEEVLEEENAKFNEAIREEVDELSESTDASTTRKRPKKKQRLTVIKLTKWSDLRKWHKLNYEGGLLNVGRSGVGKGLKNLGKKTEKLWTSMTKSFIKNDVVSQDNKQVWRSVRYDVDDKGYCAHHPHIQLKRLRDDGDWAIVRKKCPECIMEDCPTMMGEATPTSKATSNESAPSSWSAEDEHSVSQSKITSEDIPLAETNKSDESKWSSVGGNNETYSESRSEDGNGKAITDNTCTDGCMSESSEPKTLAQMISDANEIEKRSRKTVAKTASPERKSIGKERKAWHGSWSGSFMKSLSNILPHKIEAEALTSANSMGEEKKIDSSPRESGEETMNSEKQQLSLNDLPRSDPPVLVLARTRFILEHGENVLPPYHIVNSNSECIAVWCKTGRWSTLQASVFLHSTAIGNAKSATALTLGVAAAQPWLIPAFATMGLAAVGTPWLLLKVANDKWNEATMSLTEKFWMQAQPEVFVECIEKWGNNGSRERY